jgi:hypothetical protein
VILDLELQPQTTGQAPLDDYGTRAIAAIRTWDGSEDSTLPKVVTDRLYEAAAAVPEDVRLWIGSSDDVERVEIKRPDRDMRPDRQVEEALLYGWLREVNWEKRTAQLHDHTGKYVPLRFTRALHEEMLRLATRYVEVRGAGRFNKHDEWTSVRVDRLNETGSWSEPFDLDAFLDEPNPKLFDPTKVVTIDLSDQEWEAFDRAIREGREA